MSNHSIDINLINKTKYIPNYLEISYSKTFKKSGLGIIAKKYIKKGTFLGNYTGKIYLANESCNEPSCKYNFRTNINGTEVKICGSDLDSSNWTR